MGDAAVDHERVVVFDCLSRWEQRLGRGPRRRDSSSRGARGDGEYSGNEGGADVERWTAEVNGGA